MSGPPVHELLIYPVAGTDTKTPSYIADENAIPLGRDDVLWYVRNTINGPADLQDPRLDLIGKADLHNLPPTTIISAEIDPLESDGTFLTYKLQAQGVTVDRIEYGGTTHEFFGMGCGRSRARKMRRVLPPWRWTPPSARSATRRRPRPPARYLSGAARRGGTWSRGGGTIHDRSAGPDAPGLVCLQVQVGDTQHRGGTVRAAAEQVADHVGPLPPGRPAPRRAAWTP